jgi:ElaB/YqjD/DUF883 family membrane-anchored ribosome-binding protein
VAAGERSDGAIDDARRFPHAANLNPGRRRLTVNESGEVPLPREQRKGGVMTETTDASAEQGLTDQASAKVQDAASAAQEKASELREQGSARLRDQFDRRSNQTGSQARSLAEALRRSGNDLSGEGNASVSQLTNQAADRIDRVGGYLEQKSGDELMRDIETFARRRPWMLAGLGMLAGVAAARFMKASSEQRYGDYRRASGQQWPTRQGVVGTSGAYGRGEFGGGGYGADAGVVDSDVPSALSDDPLARDPYAGTR